MEGLGRALHVEELRSCFRERETKLLIEPFGRIDDEDTQPNRHTNARRFSCQAIDDARANALTLVLGQKIQLLKLDMGSLRLDQEHTSGASADENDSGVGRCAFFKRLALNTLLVPCAPRGNDELTHCASDDLVEQRSVC
jgi:hypothetical protein